jgi:hypothetical protein
MMHGNIDAEFVGKTLRRCDDAHARAQDRLTRVLSRLERVARDWRSLFLRSRSNSFRSGGS